VDSPIVVKELYEVAPGAEADFYSWGTALIQTIARAEGYLGGDVRDPEDRDGEWQIVHRWADGDVAREWAASKTRAKWLAAAEPFARIRPNRERAARTEERPPRQERPEPVERPAVDERRRSYREGVICRARPGQDLPTMEFAAPRRAAGAPLMEPAAPEAPSAPAGPPTPPPKWKTAIVTLTAVFPPVLFFNVTLIPRLGNVSVVIRTLVLCVGVTIVVTWVMMPRLMPLFRGFLNPGSQPGRRGGARPGRVRLETAPAMPEPSDEPTETFPRFRPAEPVSERGTRPERVRAR
jgi:antibiotic biosynthesis monooxygenase (ABM) superfamily enzyme